MENKKSTSIIIFRAVHALVAICAVLPLAAEIGHYDPSKNADGVVVGSIAPAQQGAVSATLMLQVDRVLKGPFQSGQVISIEWSGPPPRRLAGAIWGDHGLWLLQAGGGGNWRIIAVPFSGRMFSHLCYPVPVSAPTLPAAVVNLSPLDRIVSELSNAVQTFDPSGDDFFRTSEGLLRLPKTVSSTAAFQQMSHSPSNEIKAVGLTGLIFQGDITALKQIAPNAEALRRTHIRGRMSGAVSMVIDSSPEAVSALGELATTDSIGPGMQLSAVQALAKIHTKESLPYLALLLDSQHDSIRNQAVNGFSRFAMNLPIETPEGVVSLAWATPQGPAPHRTQETDKHIGSYGTPADKQAVNIGFWRSWWAQKKGELTKP